MAQGGITSAVPRIIRCEGEPSLRSRVSATQQREPKGAVRGLPLAMAMGHVCSCELICLREERGDASLHSWAWNIQNMGVGQESNNNSNNKSHDR